jgi:hypothetical protein
MQSKQAIYTANTAKAKIVYNKDKEVYTIKIAFNVTEQTKNGTF